MAFKEINPKEIILKPFKIIDDDWMLITAGDKDKYNTMTASWGGLGTLWSKPTSFIFIRPQRYTFEFVEKHEYYSISFYKNEFKDILSLCGSKSGRDINKAEATGLKPIFNEEAPYFEQARLVLICRKLYGQFIDPKLFMDEKINENYIQKDYHKMFFGEIVKALVNV